MDEGCVIMTIGYGDRPMPAFLDLLTRYHVESVVDVRSRPYSARRPEFSRDRLKGALSTRSIRYAFMGDTLGGRPDDPACYVNGKVDYNACRDRAAYKAAIRRIIKAIIAGDTIALMCSELKPDECHRSKLIGVSLGELGTQVQHIDFDGALENQESVLSRVTGGQQSLFGTPFFTSRKRYRPRAGAS